MHPPRALLAPAFALSLALAATSCATLVRDPNRTRVCERVKRTGSRMYTMECSDDPGWKGGTVMSEADVENMKNRVAQPDAEQLNPR